GGAVEHPLTRARYVGAGWTSAGYEAVVQDGAGERVASFAEPFGGAGLATFAARITDLVADDRHSACAIDTSSGLLGDALRRCGVRLYGVIPGPPSGTGLCSMRPAALAEAARHGTDPLSPSEGMAQGRAADLLGGIVAAKDAERSLEARG